jgi:hypothetical protein
MAKRGHSEEEILRVLREAESDETVVEVCRKHGISQLFPGGFPSCDRRCEPSHVRVIGIEVLASGGDFLEVEISPEDGYDWARRLVQRGIREGLTSRSARPSMCRSESSLHHANGVRASALGTNIASFGDLQSPTVFTC